MDTRSAARLIAAGGLAMLALILAGTLGIGLVHTLASVLTR